MNAEALARKAQDDVLRLMTPGQKLTVSHSLLKGARALKCAGLARLHPDWKQDQIDQEVSRIFRHARS